MMAKNADFYLIHSFKKLSHFAFGKYYSGDDDTAAKYVSNA